MHRQLRKLLENATGVSQYIIAVVLDIRGFTPFCQTVDSLDVATYIKKVYLKIMDDYFSNASFYKPTGDGLLIIIPYTEESLKEVINNTIRNCLDLLQNFSDLCKDEPMINFETPSKIGMGLARGSACCISSGKKILDYSGKVLNLASRLMDMARPSGIILDSSFGLELLADENKAFFVSDTVYIRGIAEEEAINIHYTKAHTLISDIYKKPIKEPKWETVEHKVLFGKFKLLHNFLSLPLVNKPLNEKQIVIRIIHDSIEGYLTQHNLDVGDKGIIYSVRGKKYYVTFPVEPIAKLLESNGVKENMQILFEIEYPTK